jgi:phosphoglucosamine mutase
LLRFGTDGVRGVAGSELTPELVVALGRAAARVLVPGGSRGPFLLGRDTRLSGPMLQAAFSAGVAAEGVEVVDLGVLPTPGVAALSAARQAPAAVISASHNVFSDNGVKLLSAGGRKLTDDQEATIEAILADRAWEPSGTEGTDGPDGPAPPRSGAALGRFSSDPDGARAYCDAVVDALEGRRLDRVRVAIDCANGAAWTTAPAILAAAGAHVVEVLGAAPDGTNINSGCGSTDPSRLAAAVVEHGADAGLAFDGDADRVIAVDDRGEVVDGDRLLALFAGDLHERGRLAGDSVVVTVMTNLGFHRAMASAGIGVLQTPVGDRYVLEALESNQWSLGGEQSGHIIFRDLATTGDGVLTGLLLLDLVARREEPLSKLAAAAMVRMPQVLRNVRVADHRRLDSATAVWDGVRALEAELGEEGRVLIRPSGTEPLVRVMVEAGSEEAASAAADRLEAVVIDALGAPAP